MSQNQKIKWVQTSTGLVYGDKLTTQEIELITKYPNLFPTEYEPEPEPKLLKRPDGSLITEPFAQKIVYIQIKRDGEVGYELKHYWSKPDKVEYGNYLKSHLANGLVFLPKDEHLAEKKAQMLTKQLEIQNEIDRLNAEEGWVSAEKETRYMVGYNYFNQEVESVTWNQYRLQDNYMSKKTAKTIFENYTQDELKQYLGIII
jgi:hypothetical protein